MTPIELSESKARLTILFNLVSEDIRQLLEFITRLSETEKQAIFLDSRVVKANGRFREAYKTIEPWIKI